MIKLENIGKWAELPTGEEAIFSNPRPRRVTLDVNSPCWHELRIRTETGDKFLALVRGRETIEFGVDGAFVIYVAPSEATEGRRYVNLYTVDGEKTHQPERGLESFTRPHMRRERDIDAELLAYKMEQRIMQRLETKFENQMRKTNVDTAASPVADGGAAAAGTAPANGGGADSQVAAPAKADGAGNGAADANTAV